jgi:hypothetical protein
MTELNNFPETDSGPAGVSWPATPAGNGGSAGHRMAAVEDVSVAAVLDRLADIPGLPVGGHADAYSALHDALLDALNDDDPSAAGDA